MGFKLNTNSENEWREFVELSPALEETQTSKFMTLSVVLHGLLIIASAFVTLPKIEIPETITVEFEVTTPVPAPQGILAPATRGASPNSLESAPSAPVVKTSAPKAKATVSSAKSEAKAPPKFTVPDSFDDMDAPDFESLAKSVKSSATKPSFSTEDLEDDLQQHNPSTQDFDSLASTIDSDVEAFAGESDVAISQLENKRRAQIAALAAKRAARSAADENAIASAIGAERAARERAAQLAAQREAAAAQMAAQMAAQQKAFAAMKTAQGQGNGGGSGSGTGAASGRGLGNNGSDMQGVGLAGSPQGTVRSLEQLRQMSGNPIPQYTNEERYRQEQGVVIFHAYVDKAGRLIKFRQMNSTGFVNLDQKTLAALQKWKFYPGQEGWVELPFRWDLKGGPKAIDGRLRSRNSMAQK